ncbi:energy-coupling factor ABC transporter ATP-binding protein [Methylobrevis pamukkalensis]|uniref:Biotin transport ATP-binding protein BioM n=1 Tax=Methylobrevis pamukkalensis TaxID=1439726 RepID=A0A1E3H063_9HYPH|nr:energy-coupling factor ABC transporter ATP-binding protein [Methylobrevis pamukkalensis]ODN69703.1 Biotin transport ATP-binding protein BioM [Methylobrevis pamukkalensis]
MRVEFQDVTVARGGRTVLAGISCVLTERRIGILGANGSGKSSLARLVNGLVLPAAGRVTVDGLDTARDARRIRSRVGFVFQNPENQIVLPIVGDDIAFGLVNLGYGRAEARQRALAALEGVGFAEAFERPAHELSGGELQLVALAAVLVTGPALVVFDEPTTSLDLRNRRRVGAAIAATSAQAIVVTHDLDLAATLDRVLVLDQGRIVFDGGPAAAIARYIDLAG